MKAVFALARNELRLLLRDRVAAGVLVGLPLLFILVLGLLLGEGFGQKPDDRLRISLVDLDVGPCPIVDRARLRLAAAGTLGQVATPGGRWAALSGLYPGRAARYPSWSQVVRTDLAETGGIRVEIISDVDEAQRLIREHRRPAVLVFRPTFSRQLNRCSFMVDGLNPFHRDGVYLEKVHVDFLADPMQPGASSIIEQVAQVSLLRVTLPFMIGKAFGRLSDPEFIQILGKEVQLPVPAGPAQFVLGKKVSLKRMLDLAAGKNPHSAAEYRAKVGHGVKNALQQQFENYDLTGQTWADLTRSKAREDSRAEISQFVDREGSGVLKRGAQRYQTLVPAYTVMFAFFLALLLGWVFVTERRQGTLKRLRAAPLSRAEILLGKLLPYYVVSLGQGLVLLTAGRLVFGMRWGPESWPLAEQAGWLLLVVTATSLAALGLALLVAAVAMTELQVALYGGVPALVLALIGGCVLPREMMPEQTQRLTLLTPQGWALAAYRELLGATGGYEPNLTIVLQACAVLAGCGVVCFVLAWALLRLE